MWTVFSRPDLLVGVRLGLLHSYIPKISRVASLDWSPYTVLPVPAVVHERTAQGLKKSDYVSQNLRENIFIWGEFPHFAFDNMADGCNRNLKIGF